MKNNIIVQILFKLFASYMVLIKTVPSLESYYPHIMASAGLIWALPLILCFVSKKVSNYIIVSLIILGTYVFFLDPVFISMAKKYSFSHKQYSPYFFGVGFFIATLGRFLITKTLSFIMDVILFPFKSIGKALYSLLPVSKRKKMMNVASLTMEAIDDFAIELKPSEKLKDKNKELYNKKMGAYVNKKGYMFEDLVAALYNLLSFNAKTTTELRNERNLPKEILDQGGSGELGVDVIVEIYDEGKPFLLLIQCKHYGGTVGKSAISEIYTAAPLYSSHFGKDVRCAVMTNNYFTKPAKNLAKSCGVYLFNREELINLLVEAQSKVGVDINSHLIQENLFNEVA